MREISLGELIEIEIQIKDQGWEKARVKRKFSTGAELRGGRVTSSNKNADGLWVQLPKYQARTKQYNHILSLRAEDEEYLESEALKKYKETTGMEGDGNQEIDLDSIEF
jgi:hypothetical protein